MVERSDRTLQTLFQCKMGLGEGSLQRLVGGGGDLKTGQFSGQKGPLGSRKEKASGGPGFPGRQGVGSHTCKVDSDRFLNTYCVPGSNTRHASSPLQTGKLRPEEVKQV